MRRRTFIHRYRHQYLMLLPGLVLGGMFVFYPIVAAVFFAMQDWSGFNADKVFVGFANFTRLMSDPFFWAAFSRSLVFLLGTVPIQMILGLVLAVILNDRLLKLSNLFRTFIFLPVVTPVAVIGIVWTFMLSPFNGPINGFLLDIGLIARPVDFLGSSDTVMPSVIGVYVWKWLGITVIYWLAALQTVPSDVYEAARLDNCKGARLIWYVILPIVAPFAVMILLISAVAALNVFPLIMSMTNGGPFFASEVMEIFVYRKAFATGDGSIPELGYAAAAGVFFGLVVLALTLLQAVIARRTRRGQTA
ncbi:sugar ABC transporter permease [Rhodophyticola sp. CCM32]|uniref:carbohydrate ABC transporter permease n=1 Tax=Rhodophyticola sp. CCM32 TaxID=2916397 RepID=UPI00107EED48|nr:sugar ABC transporter permease [Rhodophyticola sp. CCM32]QBY00806.1 sugar ABC transporter permease [Rhodophyticola sp. CCM32]